MACRFLALLLFATSLVALPAVANDLDDCDDMSLPVDVERADAEPVEPAEFVVPCAMVESGILGPACQDAAFYVVNQHGTLLCRGEFAILHQAGSLPVVEQSPATAAGGQGSSIGVALVPVLPSLLQRGSVRDLPCLRPGLLLGPADAHIYDRLRPA